MFDKPSDKESIYRVSFMHKDEIYEVFAFGIANSNLFGFIEIDELIWENDTAVVIDPTKERLREEFKDVTCIFIPLHTVLRVDIIEKTKMGSAKIVPIKEGSNVMRFPNPIYTPTRQDLDPA
jgi:hypothetical protein